jgi:hypothetical protein
MDTLQKTPDTTLGLAVARIYWILLGPLALFLLTFRIASGGGGWMTLADIFYLLFLGLLLAARWAEYRSGRGRTSTGEPMTAQGFRTVMILTACVGVSVWVFANLFGNR